MNYWSIAFAGLMYLATIGTYPGSLQVLVRWFCLTSRDSDEHLAPLLSNFAAAHTNLAFQRDQHRHPIFNLRLARRPPHGDDRWETRSTQQETPEGHECTIQNRRIIYCRHHRR